MPVLASVERQDIDLLDEKKKHQCAAREKRRDSGIPISSSY